MSAFLAPWLSRCLLWLFVAVLCLPPLTGQASSIIPPKDLGELAQLSDAVVLVRAGNGTALARGRMILTQTSFEVLEVVHGPLRVGETMQVETRGGTLDGWGWAVSGSPTFEEGTTYLLFLNRNATGIWQPRLMSYGLLEEVTGTDGSRLLTHLESAHEIELVLRPDGVDVEEIDTYYAAPLLGQLKQVMTHANQWDQTAVKASDDLLPPHIHGAKKQGGLPDPCVNITSPTPTRWNTDIPAQITFFAEATGDVEFAGAQATVQTGINQWTSIPDIDINWVYGGTRVYDAGACAGGGAVNSLPSDFSAGEGIVQFNDPCDEIDDLVGGVGTLAFGGPFFDNSPGGQHEHRGMSWFTAGIGFVVVNNGVAPVIGAGGYQSMMTHELGHSIGFGHINPADGVANMNPSCCNSITTIDQECALFAYSDDGGGGGGGGTEPSAIVLNTPTDGATGIPTTETFSWNADAQATSYRLQMSLNTGFTNLVLDQGGITSTTVQVGTFETNTTYYWRVRGTNGVGDGPWSASRMFTTVALPPSVVQLTSPLNNAELAPDAITFQWAATAGADSYDLQISPTAGFNALTFQVLGTTQMSQQLGPFDPDETYYWRVRASNSGGNGPWSTVRMFSTFPQVTGPITLLSPADDAINQPRDVTLQWQAHPGADSYQVQLSASMNFSNLIVNQAGVAGTTRFVQSLNPDVMHYWRVRGTNAGGNGDWSETWSFTTSAITPSEPVPSQPPNNATVSSTEPVRFQWNNAPNAATYQLQVARDAAFSNIAEEADGINGTSHDLGPLDPNTMFYWRVRGRNATSDGPWSTTRNFITQAAVPNAIALIAPTNNAADQSGIILFQWQSDAGADTYQLQVSTNASFTNLIYAESGLTETQRQVGPIDYGTTFYWRVRGANSAGNGPWSSIRSFTTGVGTAIEQVGEVIPTQFALQPAYPNPFNPQTTLRFDLAAPAHATLRVYDLQGRLVATLAEGSLPSGQFTYTWEATNLPSGTYLVRLQADAFVQTQQVVLVK